MIFHFILFHSISYVNISIYIKRERGGGLKDRVKCDPGKIVSLKLIPSFFFFSSFLVFFFQRKPELHVTIRREPYGSYLIIHSVLLFLSCVFFF